MRRRVIYYDPDQGYLPVRTEVGLVGNTASVESVYRGEVAAYSKFDVGGQVFRLPRTFHSEEFRKGNVVQQYAVTVDPASVALNPDLPDAVFSVGWQPADTVIYRDIDVEIGTPGSMEWLPPESVEAQHASTTRRSPADELSLLIMPDLGSVFKRRILPIGLHD